MGAKLVGRTAEILFLSNKQSRRRRG